ncbi:hypothetical protein ASPVEDRAFT_42275 [Aspergillus versicolor CBS 583.65]|uniref:Granulins domain-containing protein n=1 Tax=Aspergillus versicolor CBS 583.65 TaxID=1036611 RepID=A0A1L9PMW6_ASPVE|nr:uncharacterized protein ASPVEDRAFT_42275 [Aspergillus versicolor CBS 583.65]OJJ02765.1 hypothetical protein ASPVEDRAFT_42275 [Aspergillus versicolor CBS 583.65]
MRSILHAVGVLPLLILSTLASPDLPVEKNGRSLTPAIKSKPQIGDVTIAARDLFSRQSCGRTETECSDGCCESLTKCCDGKSCTPIGGECCSDGGSCDTGEKCCGDGCAPQLASCCGDGGRDP